ncbi:TIM-barrel domain-containing protein [uncultured Aquimarina sp.]|uniref:glycoside hydrolase family 31 protein n=1 Tax=uncultured Aquimarina sp. TaxID=575652 RepID=UPI00261304B7|nr:TIM-barrel domain-containing protein [uncultured Aquimarina sp.]
MATNLKTIFFLLITQLIVNEAKAQSGNFKTYEKENHELIFESDTGVKLNFQFYSDDIFRIHWIRKNESFFANNHYEMVTDHHLNGVYEIEEKDKLFIIKVGSKKKLQIELQKSPMKFKIRDTKKGQELLSEKNGIYWKENKISNDFAFDNLEHFCGMGYQSFGRVESIDLKGKRVSCNYGDGLVDWGAPQGVLTVPFYLSNKGYGVFLNSTFQHDFNFGKDNQYKFNIDTKGFQGQMDYYFIFGPEFKSILDRYTQLTGRPRLPQRSIFGLQLSDKGDPKHKGVEWWKNKIKEHRNAGFPLDHLVNDNRWRAGSGAWSDSWFEWDPTRTPDPKAFAVWCKENNVTITLDFNRNNAALSEGWKSEYNIPDAEKYTEHYGKSAPDYSNPLTRKWIWELFYKKSFDPKLEYPGDALWIDETDDLWQLNDSIICANGRSWAENENYYPFLISKAIVQEGWDNKNNTSIPGIGESKRPYVWVRSMSAGAQRYATHWIGDIKCDWDWMKSTIRSLQTSGLSGFPYFNHDAGGFRPPGPDDSFYTQWAMAFGSFTPIWRPHGMGENKRWPLDRSKNSQDVALTYGKMRYEMMPYIYTYAHQAHKTGIPMARAMVIDYQDTPEAWKYDLQYMWGAELLIAPSYSPNDSILDIWLPPGDKWYDYWTDNLLDGGQTIQHKANFGEIPLFVKEGAIIPKYNYAQSTFTLDPSELNIHIYTGKDSQFTLYEDDNTSEKFRTKSEYRNTKIEYIENNNKLIIHKVIGNYKEAISKRSYKLFFHGIHKPINLVLNNKKIKVVNSLNELDKEESGQFWDKTSKILVVVSKNHNVNADLIFTNKE